MYLKQNLYCNLKCSSLFQNKHIYLIYQKLQIFKMMIFKEKLYFSGDGPESS